MALNEKSTRGTVIDAVSEVVRAAPLHGLPALAAGRGAITGLYARARSYLSRDIASREVTGDVVQVEDTPKFRVSGFKVSFVLLVLLPAIAGVIYYGFIAANQYVAELRFVVRYGPKDTSLGSLVGGATSGGSGASSATSSPEDAHIVTSYIRSRSIVDDIMQRVDLREIFARPEADFVARLRPNASIDEVREFWQKMVTTNVDGMSGIVTVEVRAFRPEDGVLLAREIESLSERLVNDISVRSRHDTLSRATKEVERAQGMIYEALRDVEAYRNKEGLIDPVQTATDTGKILTEVLGDQLSAENQLMVARQSLGPDSPTVRNLQIRIEALRKQSTALREQLAGTRSTSRNIAAVLGRFEEVTIKQKMAEALYGLAVSGLDRARRAAEAQSLYLMTFVKPRLPEEYTHPKRLFLSFAVAISSLVLWSIGALVVASVEDHRL